MTELTSQHGRRGRPGRAPAARAWRPAVQLPGAALLAAGLALGAWLQNPRPAGALDLGILKALIPLRTAGLEAFYKLVEFWDGPQASVPTRKRCCWRTGRRSWSRSPAPASSPARPGC